MCSCLELKCRFFKTYNDDSWKKLFPHTLMQKIMRFPKYNNNNYYYYISSTIAVIVGLDKKNAVYLYSHTYL